MTAKHTWTEGTQYVDAKVVSENKRMRVTFNNGDYFDIEVCEDRSFIVSSVERLVIEPNINNQIRLSLKR